ncbi:unnamed protein product, partial [Musa banksii]
LPTSLCHWQASRVTTRQAPVMKADKQSTESPDRLRGSARIYRSSIKIDVPNIVSMSAYVDLTLPGSAGLCVHTIHHPIYLLSNASLCSLEGWVDAIRLVCTIFTQGKSDILASILTG